MKKKKLIIPVKQDVVDKSRRKFIKNAVLGSLALVTGCYSSFGKDLDGLCRTRESPWEQRGSEEIVPRNNSISLIHEGEKTLEVGGYRVKLEDVSFPHSEIMWDSDVKVTILDRFGDIVESDVILNPHLVTSWTSSEGVSIWATFSKFGPDEWAEIMISDPNWKVNEEWRIRGIMTEEGVPPTCEEVIVNRETRNIEMIFSPGLTTTREAYFPFGMFVPVEEDDFYYFRTVAPPIIEPAEWKGEINLWRNHETISVLTGNEFPVGDARIKVRFMNWDSDGLYADLEIEFAGGDSERVVIRSPHYRIYFNEEGATSPHHLVRCSVVADGGHLTFFADVYSGPLKLRDGETVELEGKTYKVSMDYNPEGTEISAVYLDLEE